MEQKILKWVEYDENLWSKQKLPPVGEGVLVLRVPVVRNRDLPPMINLGYLRLAAGDKDSPMFVTPGVVPKPLYKNIAWARIGWKVDWTRIRSLRIRSYKAKQC